MVTCRLSEPVVCPAASTNCPYTPALGPHASAISPWTCASCPRTAVGCPGHRSVVRRPPPVVRGDPPVFHGCLPAAVDSCPLYMDIHPSLLTSASGLGAKRLSPAADALHLTAACQLANGECLATAASTPGPGEDPAIARHHRAFLFRSDVCLERLPRVAGDHE